MDKNKAIFQIIWGALLALMGIALIFRVPYVMERIVQIEYYASINWLIRIILYIAAFMLTRAVIVDMFPDGRPLEASPLHRIAAVKEATNGANRRRFIMPTSKAAWPA